MTSKDGPKKDPTRGRVVFAMLGCMALASVVVGRAAFIQVKGDPRLDRMAKRQFNSKVLISPRRGMILDRHGEPLAINAEAKSLAANPSKVANRKTLARLLAKSLDIPYAKTYERLKGKKEFIWIKRHMSDAEIARLKHWKLLDESGALVTGLWMVNESKRIYPHGELASHVLGDVNIDSEGKEGVELWANEQLRGEVVSFNAVKDALGRPSFIDATAAKQVKDGEPVQLTLDASLQFAVEQELRAAVARTGARAGSVIVMDSVTGEILAMANEPSFNPNDSGVPAWRRRNRVLTDGYEPGSTFKAVLLASALSHGMKLSDRFHGERGSMVLQGRRISEAESHEKFEWLDLKQMIMHSSNVVSAKLALKIGPDRFIETLKSLEFGSKTRTGFPGEISGRMLPRKAWQPLTTANIGFGQGILVTPMQMLRAYASFANGGWLVQPTLIKAQLDSPAKPPRRVFSQKVSDDVTAALETVTVGKGTGVAAALEGYRVAGKTGTAQVVDPITGRYSRSRYVASFIGYPVGIEPRLVIFTSIDEPRGGYYAATTAAPLFRAVLNAATQRLSIPATQEVRSLASSPSGEGSERASEAPSLLTDSLKVSLAKAQAPEVPKPEPAIRWETGQEGQQPEIQWKMPGLTGLTAREAIRALQGHRFNLELQGSGLVRGQIPDQGKLIADNANIRLILGEAD